MSNHDDPAMPADGPAKEAPNGMFYRNRLPGLSKREYAAIHLRVPDSGDEVIDAMIRKAQRRDVAVSLWAYAQDMHRIDALSSADDFIAALEKQP